jgi:hypothetical protein
MLGLGLLGVGLLLVVVFVVSIAVGVGSVWLGHRLVPRPISSNHCCATLILRMVATLLLSLDSAVSRRHRAHVGPLRDAVNDSPNVGWR